MKYIYLTPLVLLLLFSNYSLAQINSDDIKAIEDKSVERNQETEPFSTIEEPPIFPGCEGIMVRKDQMDCLSIKVQQHVAKKFRIKIAQKLGLSPGKKRIFVMFMINKSGDIVNIKARAPHPDLEKEAIRVVKKLPKMKPGKQKGKTVGVKYSLPISFIVQE